MSGPGYLPTLPQVTSETLAVVLGAIAGALIISRLPSLKAWLQANYAAPSLVAENTRGGGVEDELAR